MAKVSGKIAFATTAETTKGKYVQTINEESFKGDLIIDRRVTPANGKPVSDVVLANKVSIVGTPFIFQNSHKIVFVRLNGVPWTVTACEVARPRLVMTLGSVYNDQTA
jgi:hypothetical protein